MTRSDRDVERLLEDWLEAEAQPMPHNVLEEALESVARTPQAGKRRGIFGWLAQGPMGVLSAAAVVLLVVVAGGLAIDRIGSIVGGPSASAGPTQTWDPVVDFRNGPTGNPAPDGYGNPDVWGYLSTFTAHDPSTYEPLTTWADGKWSDPAFVNVHIYEDLGGLILHPWKGDQSERIIILAWNSPISGDVTVRGTFSLPNLGCTGSGITFHADHGSTTLFTSQIPTAGRNDIALHVTVSRGDSLYFMVAPGSTSSCDSTLLNLTITGAEIKEVAS